MRCKACGCTDLSLIIDYGKTAVADILLTERDIANFVTQPELTFNLELLFCDECYLVQLSEFVPPELIYNKTYPYYSSVSNFLNNQSQATAIQLIKQRTLNEKSTVIEIASNDGYLLKHFKNRGIKVLGIDPAHGPANIAISQGINTIKDFFTQELAYDLGSRDLNADLLIANNVLAHVPDINDFVKGVKSILKEDGMAIFEVHYLKDMIEKCEFDTVYHQHCYYFSVIALDNIFRRNDLYINEIKLITNYGGSLRLFVTHNDRNCENVKDLIISEKKIGLDKKDGYKDFSENAIMSRDVLHNHLITIKNKGFRIAGYGAAAKACTLLKFCGIGSDFLDYIVDKNHHKHGLFMGTNHLKIEPTTKLVEDMPDYVLILAWNYYSEIVSQEAKYLENGGKFIIPIPNYRVIQRTSNG